MTLITEVTLEDFFKAAYVLANSMIKSRKEHG